MKNQENKPKPGKLIKSDNHFPVVGIGASAGGLDAFKRLLKGIPQDSGMAYVLVQHLDPSHESLLPELLKKVTSIPVLEITDDIKVEPNHIYVLPSNKMMIANDGVLQLTDRLPKSKSTRILTIDHFFASLAEVHQSHAIGVVLSGTASDGTIGLKAIKDYGGVTFAQDEESAAYESMPHSAIQAGVVDFILPPEQIPQKILEVVKSIHGEGGDEQNLSQQDELVFKHIISLLRIRKGTDFTYYKQTTIRRRIRRRMALNKNEEPAAYLKFLRENKPEQDILYQDMLIPVTGFFRDPKSFANLCETIFPLIVKSKTPDEPIRVWIAACSTGQEAYSIAISLKELLGDSREKVQVFATDISVPAIAKARAGIYTKSEVDSLSPQRLKEFFTEIKGSYQVNKQLRDMCIFAVHDFLKDPPFGKMDLISCRNVLIYMDPYLQEKALSTFHYALNPKGFLFLGKSETTGSVAELFTSAAKNDKLFSRKDGPGKFMYVTSQRSEQNMNNTDTDSKNESFHPDFQKTADDIMLDRYTPAGVVVNEVMDILYFRGNTGEYLVQSPGKPSHNLLKMAKDGLAFELRNILHKAKKEKAQVIKENVPFQSNGRIYNISIEAIPLPNTIEPHYLILFHDRPSIDNTSESIENKKASSVKTKKDDKDLRIQRFEQELAQTREDMRSITEDQEAANEELQSANEELVSSSEELQSLNEELETNREELQSANEELIIVNHEISSLNEHVTEARDYAEAIVGTIHEPMLILDGELRVKSANQSFYKIFNMTEKETKGKLLYDMGNKRWNIPGLRKLLEDIITKNSSFHDLELVHTFPVIGEKIMVVNANRIVQKSQDEQLILLAIYDVTEIRMKIRELQHKEEELLKKDIGERKEDKIRLENAIKERTRELEQANKELVFQNDEKGKRAAELNIANIELIFQNEEKGKRAAELIIANKELIFQNEEKGKRAAESIIVNKELVFQNEEKGKRAAELIIANEELVFQNNEKEKRAAELIIANKELAYQNEEKEKRAIELLITNKELQSFAYVSSHDLQEPLRKIQTFADRMIEKESENLSDTGKDYLKRMQLLAGLMQQLIDDLLAFSRINTKERKFKNTELHKIAEEVKTELRETIAKKNATVDSSGLGDAKIIPFQFRQLMHNLIGNALKFSKAEPAPIIIIKSRFEKGIALESENSLLPAGRILPEKDYYHISVADNGIGFEPHFNERIFEVFQKLHHKDEYEGTGIGLAIVKRIVDNHNGVITAKGEHNKGATFDIYIPVN